MRIISGTKKGKKLLLPDPEITRPLRDSVKENIFNILLHTKDFKTSFDNVSIIDFFSGSGSFGLECLSRGAKFVTFLEVNSSSRNILYRNLDNNFQKNKFEIKKDNFFNVDIFSLIKKINPSIIFFDPPYKIKKLEKIIQIIENIKINNVTIILHIEKKKKIKFENFKKILVRTYGLSKVIFLKN
jgi:16S rRNA (guanine966-N2)-methyltransferase